MYVLAQSDISPSYRGPTDVSEGNAPLRDELRSKLLPMACIGRIAVSDDDSDEESSEYNDIESSNDVDGVD